jgi:hypothetical protein
MKENFTRVDPDDILKRLERMEVTTWNYRAQDDAVRHIGPMAQDFYESFRVGEDNRHITSSDADGVALAAIQALHGHVKALESENADLKVKLTETDRRLRQLESALETILAGQNSSSDELVVEK